MVSVIASSTLPKKKLCVFLHEKHTLSLLVIIGSLTQLERNHLKEEIMPMFLVNTNVAKSDVPPALLSEATEELAKAMGKPAQVSLETLSSTT